MRHDAHLTFRLPTELATALEETAKYYGRSTADELRVALGLYLRSHALHMLEDPDVRAEQGDSLPRVRRELEESFDTFRAHAWSRPGTPSFPPRP